MNKRFLALLALSAAAVGLPGICRAAPSTEFIPASASIASEFTHKSSADDIQIMTIAPSENVTILGELKIQGDSDASLHDLMIAALDAAKAQGADFLALASPGSQPTLWVGKMVPAGHGRSMFVAGPVQGSEVNRIASIPYGGTGSISLIVGRFVRKAA
ncbi:MAG: hypothetical protein ABSF76_12460 [Opitutaceae bacterium]|jgi:hypothetical protein